MNNYADSKNIEKVVLMLSLKYFVCYFILILSNFARYNFVNWIQTIYFCYFMLKLNLL